MSQVARNTAVPAISRMKKPMIKRVSFMMGALFPLGRELCYGSIMTNFRHLNVAGMPPQRRPATAPFVR